MATAEQVNAAVQEVEAIAQAKFKHDPSGYFLFRPQIEAYGGHLYQAGAAFAAAHAPDEESPAFDAVLAAAAPAKAAAEALEAGSEAITVWGDKVRALTGALQAAT